MDGYVGLSVRFEMEAQMKKPVANAKPDVCVCIAALLCLISLCPAARAGAPDLKDLLDRVGNNVSAFLDVISQVNCTERLTQERIADNGRTLEKRESAFDYLLLLSNPGGEINLVESRVAADSKKQTNEKSPLLVSNGFSMLLLVFHPYYSGGFQFSLAGEETDGAESLTKIAFQHVPGTRSLAALALRGREYPLDISGTAWVDDTGVIRKLTATLGTDMQDVGLRSLNCEIDYAAVSFQSVPGVYWLPARAVVEVESRHQHWRNTHVFSAYKHFSVNTKEQIAHP
jgi:hypothetical protein